MTSKPINIMLLSHRTLESRNLHISATKKLALSHSRTCHGPHSSVFSFHRDLSWGSKHKKTTSRAGKVFKDFSTQEVARQDLTRKLLYRSALCGKHYLRRYLPRYIPISEWRFSSSWGKKPETTSISRDNAEVNGEEEEVWYTRWEKQELRQYNDLKKKIEHDPYTVLFGKSWLNAGEEVLEPRAATTSSPNSPREYSVPKNKTSLKNWPFDSKLNDTRDSENMDVSRRQSKSETMPIQDHDQEYTIDPITNRKVLNPPASLLSTSGHDKPQVKEGERAFFIREKSFSQLLLDRRFRMAELAKVLSSSNPPSKDTPIKPHNSNEWLTQEGFGGFKRPRADPEPVLQTHDAKPKSTATKIESALDRHLSSRNSNEEVQGDRPHLQYKPKENMAEDIDLLRTSDVRASAGLRGNSPKETNVDKQARRKRLEESYESCTLDRTSQLAGEAAGNKLVQEREYPNVLKGTAPEPCFGSWFKGTLQDAELKSKDASKNTSTKWVKKLSDTGNFDPVSVDQQSDSTPLSKNESVPETSKAVDIKAQAEAMDKANKLKAQIVPFKAKLDAMKANYDFLRQEWLQEIRLMRKRAARKEEEMKAQRIANKTREIHEAEIEKQKKAMEAMEIRRSDEAIKTTKTTLAQGIENDDAEKPAPRRLQSFLQGEGDMASNVHEFAGRDRWYKRKAPHAMDAKDAEMDAKLQKLATDRALIREVRGIYEDTYGTIDTKHRQPHICSNSPFVSPVRPITSSSGTGAPHAQLPLTSAGVKDTLEVINNFQITDAQVIIQKLFSELREIQSTIQDLQKHPSDSNKQDTHMSKVSIAFVKSVMQILDASNRLATFLPGRIWISQVSVKEILKSEKPSVNRPPSTKTPQSINPVVQKATKLNTYCILAYDSATESVKSIEATMLAPFSKEESFLPLDALSRLNDHGKFLSHVTSLGDKGYELVSGTTNILVFKKEVAPQDLAETKKTDVKKEPSPHCFSLDHMPVTPDGPSDTRGTIKDDIQEYRQARMQESEAEQQKVKEAQEHAVEKSEREDQQVEKASKTAVDGIMKEKQPLEGVLGQPFAPSVSPNNTSRKRVHRQERVFSGSHRGRWIDHKIKSKRSRRAADRRRKTLKHMLAVGAFTAACCYCVGVVSEMMH